MATFPESATVDTTDQDDARCEVTAAETTAADILVTAVPLSAKRYDDDENSSTARRKEETNKEQQQQQLPPESSSSPHCRREQLPGAITGDRGDANIFEEEGLIVQQRKPLAVSSSTSEELMTMHAARCHSADGSSDRGPPNTKVVAEDEERAAAPTPPATERNESCTPSRSGPGPGPAAVVHVPLSDRMLATWVNDDEASSSCAEGRTKSGPSRPREATPIVHDQRRQQPEDDDPRKTYLQGGEGGECTHLVSCYSTDSSDSDGWSAALTASVDTLALEEEDAAAADPETTAVAGGEETKDVGNNEYRPGLATILSERMLATWNSNGNQSSAFNLPPSGERVLGPHAAAASQPLGQGDQHYYAGQASCCSTDSSVNDDWSVAFASTNNTLLAGAVAEDRITAPEDEEPPAVATVVTNDGNNKMAPTCPGGGRGQLATVLSDHILAERASDQSISQDFVPRAEEQNSSSIREEGRREAGRFVHQASPVADAASETTRDDACEYSAAAGFSCSSSANRINGSSTTASTLSSSNEDTSLQRRPAEETTATTTTTSAPNPEQMKQISAPSATTDDDSRLLAPNGLSGRMLATWNNGHLSSHAQQPIKLPREEGFVEQRASGRTGGATLLDPYSHPREKDFCEAEYDSNDSSSSSNDDGWSAAALTSTNTLSWEEPATENEAPCSAGPGRLETVLSERMLATWNDDSTAACLQQQPSEQLLTKALPEVNNEPGGELLSEEKQRMLLAARNNNDQSRIPQDSVQRAEQEQQNSLLVEAGRFHGASLAAAETTTQDAYKCSGGSSSANNNIAMSTAGTLTSNKNPAETTRTTTTTSATRKPERMEGNDGHTTTAPSAADDDDDDSRRLADALLLSGRMLATWNGHRHPSSSSRHPRQRHPVEQTRGKTSDGHQRDIAGAGGDGGRYIHRERRDFCDAEYYEQEDDEARCGGDSNDSSSSSSSSNDDDGWSAALTSTHTLSWDDPELETIAEENNNDDEAPSSGSRRLETVLSERMLATWNNRSTASLQQRPCEQPNNKAPAVHETGDLLATHDDDGQLCFDHEGRTARGTSPAKQAEEDESYSTDSSVNDGWSVAFTSANTIQLENSSSEIESTNVDNHTLPLPSSPRLATVLSERMLATWNADQSSQEKTPHAATTAGQTTTITGDIECPIQEE